MTVYFTVKVNGTVNTLSGTEITVQVPVQEDPYLYEDIKALVSAPDGYEFTGNYSTASVSSNSTAIYL